MRSMNALLTASIFLLFRIPQTFAAPPGGHLNVTQVMVDDPDNPASIMISGEDFDFGNGPLVATLGDAA